MAPTDTYTDRWGVTERDETKQNPFKLEANCLTISADNGRAQYRITSERVTQSEGHVYEASLVHGHCSHGWPLCTGDCPACQEIRRPG